MFHIISSNYAPSHRSKASSASSTTSSRSDDSRQTQNTTLTSYSETRPPMKHAATDPYPPHPVLDSNPYNDDNINPRSSVETYASTIPSTEDLQGQLDQDLPPLRPERYARDTIPSTAPDFAELFPSGRRLLIQHDDATSDGNMNLRVDTAVTTVMGHRTKMTLFHLRMRDLHERQFSLRRYCRDSGREICHSKKKYVKPGVKPQRSSRPSISRSLTTALHTLGLKNNKSHQRNDSGYESDEGDIEDELRNFTLTSEVQATVPTNTIRVEFSNYAQVEITRHRSHEQKMWEFEYWGEAYLWTRELYEEDKETFYSYELLNTKTGERLAYIMPDKLSHRQAQEEESMGGWVPPCSMRVLDGTISPDLGDVVVATGLIILSDDCIKRRWHNRRNTSVASHFADKTNAAYVDPETLMNEVFHRSGYTTIKR